LINKGNKSRKGIQQEHQ